MVRETGTMTDERSAPDIKEGQTAAENVKRKPEIRIIRFGVVKQKRSLQF